MGLDGSIIILFYLEQQHSSLQQAQSQLQLQGFPFSHPLQEHSPLQHLHFLSQHDLFLLFIIFSKKYLLKSTHHPTNKLIVECKGLLFQKITKNNITMCANLISIPRTPVVKEWVKIIELKK